MVLSVLAIGSPPATAASNTSIDVADDTEGATTVHNWSTTAGTSGTLTDVRLNYSGSDTNVSAVSTTNISVTVNGTTANVHDTASVEGDRVLEINVSDTTFDSGEVIKVNATQAEYVNPSVGDHYPTIELHNGGSLLETGTASFSTVGRNTVDGTVTNASDGSAIAGATVSAFDEQGTYTNTTDANGNYSIDLPDGTYTVRVDPDWYLVNQTDGVQVSGSATVTTDLAVEPAGAINGTVRNDSGSTIGGATVSAYDSQNNFYSTTADGSGEYKLEVPAGTYTVEADNESYAPTSVDSVTVTVGQNTTRDFALSDAAVVTGKLTDAAGNSVSGATVQTYDENFENFQSTQSDKQGNYELEVANGTYTVEVSKSGYASARETGIAATEGQTTTRDVTLERAATIGGTVTDAGGSPLGNVEVVVHDDGYQTYEFVKTDHKGRYSIDAPAGTYTVRADKSGYARETAQVEGTAGQTTTRDFALGTPAVITGTVTDSNDDPVNGAFVLVEDGDSYYYNQTNASGGYEVDVPAGDYSVTAFNGSEMGTGSYVEGAQTGNTYTVDVGMVDPTIHHTNVTHVGGKSPDMGNISVNAQVMGGMMMTQLVDDTPNGMPHDLSDSGVDNTTEFEITVTVEDYDPSTLLWGVRDVNWSTSPNGTIANATDITVRTKAVNLQGINQAENGGSLPVGPTTNYESVSWPTGSDDKADLGWNNTVYFGVFDMSNVPSEVAGNADNMTIATNAQTFSRPQVTDDGLKVYVAGPHLTTYGEEHDGFYDAFIPNAQLDSWGVDDPSSDLNALYKGDSSNFAVEETGDGAWIRLDISYSDGTVEIAPKSGGGSSGGPSFGGSYSGGGSEETETPAPTTSGPTTTDSDVAGTPAPTTARDDSGTTTATLDTRTATPAGTTDAPGGQPGFGLLVSLVALVGTLALRRRLE